MPKRFSNTNSKPRRRVRKNTFQPVQLGGVKLPKINQKPIQTRCLRYIGTSVTTQTIFSVADLRGMIGTCVSGTTAFTPIIDGFQIRRIGVSAVLSGTTGSGGITFTWEGPNVPDIAYTNFLGNAVPITESYYPPPDSSTGWWWDNSATSVNLFSIRTTAVDSGDVTVYLDIDFMYNINSGAVTPLTLTTNPGLTGIVYPRMPLTQTTFVPFDLDTVTTV